MTTLTADDFVTRVRAILALIPGIGTDVTNGADLAATPGYEAYLKGGRHLRTAGSKRRTVERVVGVRVYYVALINDDFTKEAPISNARTSAQIAVDDFVAQIYTHVNLGLNDGGAAPVGDISDSFGLMQYNNRTYYGFDLELPITYNRN